MPPRVNFVTSTTTWRDRLANIKAARAEAQRFAPISTQREQIMDAELLAEEIRLNRRAILDGVTGEWSAAIDATRQALGRVEKARAAEAQRWDSGKLAAELSAYKMLTDLALQSKPMPGVTVEKRLRAIYQDAKITGDPYKIRAAAEIFVSLSGRLGSELEDRMSATALVMDAQNDLAEVRKFAELDAAHSQAAQAVEGLNQARQTLVETGEILGDMLEIGKHLNRVKATPQGLEFSDLDPSDPHPHETITELRARIFGEQF